MSAPKRHLMGFRDEIAGSDGDSQTVFRLRREEVSVVWIAPREFCNGVTREEQQLSG